MVTITSLEVSFCGKTRHVDVKLDAAMVGAAAALYLDYNACLGSFFHPGSLCIVE